MCSEGGRVPRPKPFSVLSRAPRVSLGPSCVARTITADFTPNAHGFSRQRRAGVTPHFPPEGAPCPVWKPLPHARTGYQVLRQFPLARLNLLAGIDMNPPVHSVVPSVAASSRHSYRDRTRDLSLGTSGLFPKVKRRGIAP
jgi:hypothetical protein